MNDNCKSDIYGCNERNTIEQRVCYDNTFVLLYILAKTTKERDKASMESARNIIIYKEKYAYRAEEYLEQVHQYFGMVSRLSRIMAIWE